MPRFVIFVEGGLVQEVLSDEDCEYLIIDQDVTDDEEAREITDTTGGKFIGCIQKFGESPDLNAVDHYFKQAE